MHFQSKWIPTEAGMMENKGFEDQLCGNGLLRKFLFRWIFGV
jgi:hypothetical protein